MLTHVKDYLYKTRWTIVLITFITFIAHGSILFSQRFGIDTDIIMQGMHPFNKNGRPALIWISNLLEFDWFNLYHVQALTIIFMIFAPISFGYLFYRIGSQEKFTNITLLVLALAFIISPFWVTQIYFMNQCAQVLLAYTLTAISILCAEEARKDFRGKWYCFLIALVLMQFTFGSYQVLTVVYIAVVAASYLILFFKEKETLKKQLQWIGYHAGTFLVGFIIYMITYKVFFSDLDGYLQGHINWEDSGIVDGILYCLYAIRDSLQCHAPYYTGFYGFFILLFLVITILQLRRTQKGQRLTAILYIAVELFLIITPYIFIFIQGGQISDRLQLILPLSQGCILYLTTLFLSQKDNTKLSSVFAKIVSILLI